MKTEMTQNAVDSKIAKAEYHMYATNEYGERLLVMFGNKEDLEAVKMITDPNANPEIVKNH